MNPSHSFSGYRPAAASLVDQGDASNTSCVDHRQIQMALMQEQRRRQQHQIEQIEKANLLQNITSPSSDLLSSLLQQSDHPALLQLARQQSNESSTEDKLRMILAKETRSIEHAFRMQQRQLKLQEVLGEQVLQHSAHQALQQSMLQSPQLRTQALPGYYQDKLAFPARQRKQQSIIELKATQTDPLVMGVLKRSATEQTEDPTVLKKARSAREGSMFPVPSLKAHKKRETYSMQSYKRLWGGLGHFKDPKEIFLRHLYRENVNVTGRSVILEYKRRRRRGSVA